MLKNIFLVAISLLLLVNFCNSSYPSTLMNRNSHLRFRFLDENGNTIEKNKIFAAFKYKDDNRKNQYFFKEYESFHRDSELIYFPIPCNRSLIAVYITAENSADFLVISPYQYYKIINSPVEFQYYISKVFVINGSKRTSYDEIDKMDTYVKENNHKFYPKIDLRNNAGRLISQSSAEKSLIINAEGFDKSEKIELYFDGKKISMTPIAYGSFGLKFQIPKNIKTGNHKIRLQGNIIWEKAEATIKIVK